MELYCCVFVVVYCLGCCVVVLHFGGLLAFALCLMVCLFGLFVLIWCLYYVYMVSGWLGWWFVLTVFVCFVDILWFYGFGGRDFVVSLFVLLFVLLFVWLWVFAGLDAAFTCWFSLILFIVSLIVLFWLCLLKFMITWYYVLRVCGVLVWFVCFICDMILFCVGFSCLVLFDWFAVLLFGVGLLFVCLLFGLAFGWFGCLHLRCLLFGWLFCLWLRVDFLFSLLFGAIVCLFALLVSVYNRCSLCWCFVIWFCGVVFYHLLVAYV